MAYLTSFGGITRIRFKGFDRLLSPIISARRLPRTGSRIERPGAKSTAPKMKMSILDLRQRSYGTITADRSDGVGVGVGVGEGSCVICALEVCRR